MNTSNIKFSLLFVCLFTLTLPTLFGCSTTDSREKFIALQKKHITNLQRHVQRQDRVIQKLKVNKWTSRDSKWSQKKGLQKVDGLIKKKQWPRALRTSSVMIKKFPNWQTMRSRRIQIFKAMGLNRQVKKEQNRLRTIQAKKQKKTSFIR